LSGGKRLFIIAWALCCGRFDQFPTFVLSKAFRTALDRPPPPAFCSVGNGARFPQGIKRQELEVDHSAAYAKVENEWSYTATPLFSGEQVVVVVVVVVMTAIIT
jgi:hypothetical protein